MGCKKGFLSFVNKKNKNISVVYYLLHRENLAEKEIQKDLALVFKKVVFVVNFTKSLPLHTRLFTVLCDQIGAEHNGLLFHSNCRWLSQGKVLERVLSLRNEIDTFLKEQKHEFVDRFSDDKWIAKLLFLADFFSHVNQLNSSMQEKEKNFLDLLEGIGTFQAKIKLWLHRMESGKLAAFPILNLFVEKNIELRGISRIFLDHFIVFVSELDRYISSHNYSKIFNWMQSPLEV